MKKNMLKHLVSNYKLIAITSALLISSCTKDNEALDSEENTSLSGTNASFATPSAGNIYTIKNRDNGRTLDIQGKSNSNGANLQVWGTNANTTNTHRQWEVVAVGNYFRLRGIDSGKSLEVSGGSNSNGANVQQWTYQGTTHQQWEIAPVGNGYFRLKNRDSGKSLRVRGSSNGSNADQASYNGSENQQWFFTRVGGSTTVEPISTTPNDDDDDDDNNGNDNSFISTNDGTFNLSDFQIESSSHLSSSTSTSTTSWSYNSSSLLGTEWYRLSGGDYYLKSAKRDGKRTEFKEEPGKERSLNTNKILKYEASIDDIPENGVTIAQVHNRGGVRRPYLRVYIEDGRIEVKETTNALTNSSGTYNTVNGPSYSENSKLKVQITTRNGSVNVKVETTRGTLDEDFTPRGDSSYKNDYYLKAGVYTEGNDTEPEIRFYSFQN